MTHLSAADNACKCNITPIQAIRPQDAHAEQKAVTLISEVANSCGGERASETSSEKSKRLSINEEANEVILIQSRGYGKRLGGSMHRGATAVPRDSGSENTHVLEQGARFGDPVGRMDRSSLNKLLSSYFI